MNLTTVSQLMAQIRELQNKVKFLVWCKRIFWSWIRRPTFLIKLPRFWVPGPCHAAILDCREIHRIVQVFWETFLNDHLLKKDYLLQSSTIHCEIETWYHRYIKTRWWNDKRIVEYTDSRSSLPKQKWNVVPHGWNLLSQWYGWWSENSFLELNLGKCPDSTEFHWWKVNFRTEFCLRTADPRRTHIAIDCGPNWFPWFRYAWCDD